MASLSDFLASRKTETKKASAGVCDLTAPIYAGLTRDPEFDTRNINKIYGAFVQHVLNTEHNQNGDTDKPEAAKRHITAMQAMLDWLAEADTNHVCVRGKMFRLTLVPTETPDPVPLPDKVKPGNPAGAK